MLCVNFFIGKIMRIDNQTWYRLEIFGSEEKREIFIAYIQDIVGGVNNYKDSSFLYFEEQFYEQINSSLDTSPFISKWEWSNVEEENWVKNCKDSFKPIIISNKVRIIPSWENSDNNNLNIIINPALAFGTGHHETTHMMVESMLGYDFNDKTVFDIGCGSGILSILANKLGAKDVYAIDYDVLTYNNFYENLDLNGIDNNIIKFEIKDCFDIMKFDYDFILANINLNILKKLLPMIVSDGTILIISGILKSDEKSIIDVLNNSDKTIKNIYQKNEWLCFVIEL